MSTRSKAYSLAVIAFLTFAIILWVSIPLFGGQRSRPVIQGEYPASATKIFSVRPVSGLVPMDEQTSTINSLSPVLIAENQSPQATQLLARLRFTNSTCTQPGRLRIFVEGSVISDDVFTSDQNSLNIDLRFSLSARSSVLLPMILDSVPCAPVNAGGVTYGTLDVLEVTPDF